MENHVWQLTCSLQAGSILINSHSYNVYKISPNRPVFLITTKVQFQTSQYAKEERGEEKRLAKLWEDKAPSKASLREQGQSFFSFPLLLQLSAASSAHVHRFRFLLLLQLMSTPSFRCAHQNRAVPSGFGPVPIGSCRFDSRPLLKTLDSCPF